MAASTPKTRAWLRRQEVDSLRKVVAASVIIAVFFVLAPQALAGPLDPVVDLYRDTTAPVRDLYDRKLGCGSSDPVLCPGP
jgi:hypothetical protein